MRSEPGLGSVATTRGRDSTPPRFCAAKTVRQKGRAASLNPPRHERKGGRMQVADAPL